MLVAIVIGFFNKDGNLIGMPIYFISYYVFNLISICLIGKENI